MSNFYHIAITFQDEPIVFKVSSEQIANEFVFKKFGGETGDDFRFEKGQYFSYRFRGKNCKEYEATFSLNDPFKINIYNYEPDEDGTNGGQLVAADIPWICTAIENFEGNITWQYLF